MITIRTTAAVFAITALSCAQSGPVRAPQPNRPSLGALEGFVSDTDGVALAGVVVVAGNDHERLVTVTDDAGRYVFPSVPSGVYQVEFDPCQVAAVTKAINVRGNDVASLDASLDDGGPIQLQDTLDIAPGTVRDLDVRVASLEPTVAAMKATVSAATGAIHGTVRDSVSLRPVEGVTVVISSPSVQGAYSAITGTGGTYNVGQLPPGTYTVTLYFETTTLHGNNIVVHANKITGLDQLMDMSAPSSDTVVLSGTPVTTSGEDVQTIHDYIDSIPVPAEQFAEALLSGGSAHGVVFATPKVTVEMATPDMPERGLSGVDADEVWIIAKADSPVTTGPATNRRRHYGSGQVCAYIPATRKHVALPIKSTDVYAKVVANAAGVDVEQSYHNPNSDKIEALYVFPLPDNAAVSDFVMTVGKRRIRGIIRERDQAIKLYDEAREAGYVASLLTQERPNIFTHQIANIDPGKDIDIKLSYYNMLPYRDGAYSFVFPTVVGPRHNPPQYMHGVGAVARGDEGKSGQPVEVSYLAPNETTDHRISITVDIDAGVQIDAIDSNTHAISSVYLSDTQRRVTLAKGEVVPNRDYALSYSVKADERSAAALVHQQGGDDYFTLVLHPPESVANSDRSPVELTLVVDTSGSMEGDSLDIAKRAARRMLEALGDGDSFRIVQLAAKSKNLSAAPMVATAENKARGLEYIDGMYSSGGSALSDGITYALGSSSDDERMRVVAVLTDGYIGDEDALLEVVHDRRGDARVFGIGVGTAVNRFLLESISSMGGGAVAYLGHDADAADEVVDSVTQRITYPAMTDIALDFGDIEATEIYPATIPDLYVGRPVVITGRLDGKLAGVIKVRGKVGGVSVTDTIELDADATTAHPAVAKIWARAKIAELSRRAVYAPNADKIADEILEVAAKHGIASDRTGFVAVDSATRTDDTQAMQVKIPGAVPAGVRYDKAVDEK
jgi:Ca-activated chloride channel family protein